MILVMYLFEPRVGHMGIDLGSSDGGMPKHFLDGPDIGALS